MKIQLQTRWQTSDPNYPEIEPLLFKLLEMMGDNISLRQAATTESVSYRHAWGIIKKWEKAFHQALVKTRRGRSGNNELTEFGLKLLKQYQTTTQQHAAALSQDSARINQALQIENVKHIRFFASHDLAVTQLSESLKDEYKDQLIIQTHGSLDAIKLFAQKQCDVIGFHYPLNPEFSDLIQEYKNHLKNTDCVFIKLAVRTQGLIIAKNNPKKIQSINDLSKRSVRFINRQPDSGTRIFLDALFKQQNIPTKSINGYQQEEFTHLAVAAMIASGVADVGMGIEAAAKQFNLGFIPLIQEQYVIAFQNTLSKKILTTFENTLKSKPFLEYLKSLKGYETKNCGKKLNKAILLK